MPPRKQIKKSTPSKATKEETSEAPAEWWDDATPMGDVLLKMEGINYYELSSIGELTVSTIEDREVKNVAFAESKHLLTTDVRGNPVKDSGQDKYSWNNEDEPTEGTLFVPFSVARKIRGYLEEKEMPQESLIGNILCLQKTGTKLQTRYPLIEIITPKEFNS